MIIMSSSVAPLDDAHVVSRFARASLTSRAYATLVRLLMVESDWCAR